MSIDLKQFHQIYFEECFEKIQVMESGMLNLAGDDVEQINVIFRAAHSIKGGSATFGFQEIASFTHHLETLLDEMRKGLRAATKEVVDLLLQSVDCLREMLKATQDGLPLNMERTLSLSREFEPFIKPKGIATMPVSVAAVPKEQRGWRITLRSSPDLFCSGNDPVRLFRALQDFGELTVTTDLSQLPALSDMDPELCYLNWELILTGDAPKDRIAEIFEWLEGDCEIEITPLSEDEKDQSAAAPPLPGNTSVKDEASETAAANPLFQEHRSPGDRRAGIDRRREVSSIRVGIDKIDALINMVGELVITQAMLSQIGESFDIRKLDRLRDGLDQLERNTHELQESVMRIRMLPISSVFDRFTRLVHDFSEKSGKEVDLQLSGEQTELDKTVLEKIADPLVHLVRNSLDHGIETPDVRIAAGKNRKGIIRLSAYHKGGNVVIEINDDGAGINRKKLLCKAKECGAVGQDEELSDEKIVELIFLPGFSTAETISDISGRGVGMDVVRRNIRELQGNIEIKSIEGQGTTMLIRLPLTLAILDGQLVRVEKENCIIPLTSICESLQIEADCISNIAGRAELYTLRGNHIPIIRLADLFGFRTSDSSEEGSLLVVVEAEGKRVGLIVDELLGQQQVVIKSLETNFKKIDGVSGATILGDGTVALILDITGMIALSQRAAQLEMAQAMGGVA